MDTSKKVIRGIVNSRGFTTTSAITQWDYGWQFIPEIEDLPPTYRLDFSNEEKHGTALPVYCGSEGAEVPTELIDTGKDVWVWFVRIGEGYGITEYKWRIPNKCKPKTEQDEPTPSQQSSIDQAISVVNEAVETVEQKASEADQSAQNASQDANRAERAKTSAETAQGKAEEAQESAERAKDDASESERKAKGYAETASEKADSILNLTASAHTLPEGSSASANYDAETGVISFGIPKGDKGESPYTVELTSQTIPLRLDADGYLINDLDFYVKYVMRHGTEQVWGKASSSRTIGNITYTRLRECTPTQEGLMRFQIPRGTLFGSGSNYNHNLFFWWDDALQDTDYIEKRMIYPFVHDGDDYTLTAQDKQDIADMVDVPTKVYHPRITALNNAKIMDGEIVEVSEIPEYVDDPSKYSEYGIMEDGWYVFARIQTKGLDTVSAQTSVFGADGYIANVGASYVDVAIRFEVAATSKTIAITWNANDTEVFVFKATDLAVRNLDYRTTFYVYDITPYRTWSYALTSDTKFVEGKNYYILSDGEYVLAEVTAGDAIPADTYYNHSKLHFEGMARNVTYNLQEVVDCPIEIVLPEIPKNGYGAWFDIQMRYDDTHSCTLLPPEGVKIGTAQTQSQTKGVNIFELQYTDAGDVKMWTLLNTHSNIPS